MLNSQSIARRAIRHSRPASQRLALNASTLYILDKRQTLVPLALNRVQTQLLSAFEVSPFGRHLILKARQLGVSTIIQAWIHLQAWTRTCTAVTLAHDMETGTKLLRAMARRFYEHLPPGCGIRRVADSDTQSRYLPTDSTLFIGTSGSADRGRGGTFSHLHGSEVAYWKDASAQMAGLMQGVPHDYGHILLESTANGQQGWFYERCMRALDGDRTWQLHFFPWWSDDDYRLPVVEPLTLTDEERTLQQEHGLDEGQIAFRRSKQAELGEDFAREYAEDPRACFMHSVRGLIYPNFTSANVTDAAEYRPDLPVYWGLDDGYAPGGGRGTLSYHPRVILFAQHNEIGGINIFDEMVVTGEHAESTIAAALTKPYSRPGFIFVDSSASECKLRAWEKGLQTVGATHPVSEGIKNLRRLICDGQGMRLLRIHPRCAETIYEMGQYHYIDAGTSNVGEQRPLKQDDHALDALRYLTFYLARQGG